MMSKIFLVSDTHWGHAKIITYCNRPFKNVEEMDKALIENWNSVVSPEDIVYHLGDVVFKGANHARQMLDSLNGKIYLVRGNHDKDLRRIRDRFEFWPDGAEYKDLVTIEILDEDAPRGVQPLVLCHYALRSWDRKTHGAIHCFGHSHGTLTDDPFARSLDVGVDCHNFRPISYEEVKDIMIRIKRDPDPPKRDEQ